MTKNLDPTTISIIARGLHAAAEEMGANLVRSAFSTVVREARDCSTALLDPGGNICAQAEMIPMQTAALSMSFKAAMAALDLEDVAPGHGIFMNDPYHGGQHLNDLILFTPIFEGDVLLGYAGSTAHHLDIGGATAGITTQAKELIQEGLVFPPILFDVVRDWNGGMLEKFLAANIRVPEIGVGDMNAQFAANYTGAERVRELTGGTGVAPRDVTPEAIEPLLDRVIPGFGELFRMLSYEEIGSAALLSRALAGIARGKVVFVLPGSRGAVQLALEKLILPELGHLAAEAVKTR